MEVLQGRDSRSELDAQHDSAPGHFPTAGDARIEASVVMCGYDHVKSNTTSMQ